MWNLLFRKINVSLTVCANPVVTKFPGRMGRGTGSRVDTFEWVLQVGGENDPVDTFEWALQGGSENDSAFPGRDRRSRVEGWWHRPRFMWLPNCVMLISLSCKVIASPWIDRWIPFSFEGRGLALAQEEDCIIAEQCWFTYCNSKWKVTDSCITKYSRDRRYNHCKRIWYMLYCKLLFLKIFSFVFCPNIPVIENIIYETCFWYSWILTCSYTASSTLDSWPAHIIFTGVISLIIFFLLKNVDTHF
jgi:hypothetical protein